MGLGFELIFLERLGEEGQNVVREAGRGTERRARDPVLATSQVAGLRGSISRSDARRLSVRREGRSLGFVSRKRRYGGQAPKQKV